MNGSWDEATLAYDHIKAYGSEIATNDSGANGQWEEFDVTTFVRDVVLKEQTNNGFLLRFIDNNQNYRCEIVSSENPQAEKRPKLEITYNDADYIQVLKPNGGDVFKQSYSYEIKWVSNIADNVTIELIENATVVSVIAENISNTGTYKWKVPLETPAGENYKIRIKSVTTGTIIDESDAVFTILESKIVKDFPYIQDFDTFTVKGTELSDFWMQETFDDFDWTVYSGATPSNIKADDWWNKTGPSGDHTSGTGNYLYTEATGNSPTKKAEIYTPIFDLKNVTKGTMSFWYHMWSEQEASWSNYMGDLYVDVNVDGVWQNGVFHKKKSQGEEWLQFEKDITEFSGSLVQFRFRGITGSDFASDMAIDDFKMDVTTNVVSKTVGNKEVLVRLRSGYLLIDNCTTPLNVSLMSLSGRVIRQYNNLQSNQNLNFNWLPGGFYLIEVKSAGYSKSLKLSVK